MMWRRLLREAATKLRSRLRNGRADPRRQATGVPQDARATARAGPLTRPASGHDGDRKALGLALLQQGRAEEAAVMLQKAAELDSTDADAWRYLGIALQQRGRSEEAEASYRRALQIEPDLADVHCNLSNILNDCGRFAEAEASCRRALPLLKDDPRPCIVLGNALMGQGRFGEAESSYRQALELDPHIAAAHNYLAIALRAQGRLAEAEACCRQALALKPDFAGAHNILGATMLDRERFAEAEASFQRALELDPQYAAACGNLGNALRAQGKTAAALACYRRLTEIDPEDDVALHWYAALSGSDAESAPRAYVSTVFDNYAKTFDAHLLGVLGYRIPEQIVELILDAGTPRDGTLDVLDLGCGTGLVGAAIAPYARALVGVDLAGKMLERAGARNVYTRLVQADLLEMTRHEASASYDAITAADVFIYVGRIDEVVEEARRLLRRGGVLGFSIESLDALHPPAADAATMRDVRLLPTARFAHSSAYLKRLALQHGFEIRHFSPTTIRLENGSPIQGWLVLWSA